MNKKHFIKPLTYTIILFIIVIIHAILPEKTIEIIYNLFLVLLILFVTIVLFIHFRKSFRNKKIISKADKTIIEKSKNKINSINIFEIKNITSEDRWYIHDEIEYIINLCNDFLKGYELYENQKDIKRSIKELEDYIKKEDIKELKVVSKEIHTITNILFKYYDNNGEFIKGKIYIKNKRQTLLLVLITATTGALSAIIGLKNTLIIIGIICPLLFISLIITVRITKKINKCKLTDEDKKWNEMLDLWIDEKLESPYTELMTYYNEVMNGGHSQYFTNVNNTSNLKKEMSSLKNLLETDLYNNLNKAYKTHIKLEELCLKKSGTQEQIAIEEKILEECDNYFFDHEQNITDILKKYASKLEKNSKEE